MRADRKNKIAKRVGPEPTRAWKDLHIIPTGAETPRVFERSFQQSGTMWLTTTTRRRSSVGHYGAAGLLSSNTRITLLVIGLFLAICIDSASGEYNFLFIIFQDSSWAFQPTTVAVIVAYTNTNKPAQGYSAPIPVHTWKDQSKQTVIIGFVAFSGSHIFARCTPAVDHSQICLSLLVLFLWWASNNLNVIWDFLFIFCLCRVLIYRCTSIVCDGWMRRSVFCCNLNTSSYNGTMTMVTRQPSLLWKKVGRYLSIWEG